MIKLALLSFCAHVFSACVSAEDGQEMNSPISQQETAKPSISPRPQDTDEQRKPNRAVLSLLGRAQKSLDEGRLDSAEGSLERAYRIDSKDPQVAYLMAQVLYARGEEGQAENWGLKAIHLLGDSHADKELKSRAWQLISRCRLRQGDFEGADRAIEASHQ